MGKLLLISIPCFSKDEVKNLQVIREIMRAYQKISSKRVQLEKEISDLEEAINQRIYKFYDLNKDEIEFIKSSLEPGSTIIRLLG